MKIVVCLKQVPDTTAVKIDPKTGTLIRDGVPSIINPEDKHALEAALQLKDNNGAEVTVLSMGPPQAKSALREALCMGADKAILITDRAFAGADTLATSKALAGALKKLEYDIIFAGRQAIDGDTAQVGPEIAEHIKELNEPRYMNVKNIFETSDDEILVWSADDIDVDKAELGLKGSPTKVKRSMTKEAKGAGEIVKESPKDSVTYVLGKLKEKHYI